MTVVLGWDVSGTLQALHCMARELSEMDLWWGTPPLLPFLLFASFLLLFFFLLTYEHPQLFQVSSGDGGLR